MLNSGGSRLGRANGKKSIKFSNLFFFSVAVEFIFSVSTSIALSKDHNLFIFPFIILRFYDYLGT